MTTRLATANTERERGYLEAAACLALAVGGEIRVRRTLMERFDSRRTVVTVEDDPITGDIVVRAIPPCDGSSQCQSPTHIPGCYTPDQG